MGSDMGPEELIIGVKKALAEDKSNYEIIIVGNESVITPMLLRHNLIRESRIKVYHASEVIEMDEKPIQAIKSKRDSSMMRAIEIVKLGTADAVLSCGTFAYTHLRAHETVLDLVCRLLLEKKKYRNYT